MCGIFGAVNMRLNEAMAMECLNKLEHRGPDGFGLWQKEGVTLGHRRLAILDLTDNGKQPMSYADERYHLTFNGEIYNFIEIRNDLLAKGYSFNSECDSEVILAAYIEWGKKCLDRFNGMWAFAIWDEVTKELFISRDRFGIKPLYYMIKGDSLVFASEMKAILPLIDNPSADMTTFGIYRDKVHYENQDRCLIEGINRFPAGAMATFSKGKLTISRWYNTLDHLMEVPSDYNEQVELFRELFLDSCKLRMRSDVTIGTALSGGLDSSAAICAMADIAKNNKTGRMSKDWQHAFVACFPHTNLDESAYAKKVTDYLGIESTFLELEDTVTESELYRYVYLFEELYTNMQVPMIKIYEQERKYNSLVSIDGHGADELFGGYSFDIIKAIPDATAKERDAIIKTYIDMNKDMDIALSDPEFRSTKVKLLKDILPKLAIKKLLGMPLVKSEYSSHPAFKELDNLNKTLFVSTHETILPTLLRNYDRTSMINGIEIRMPFMDYRLIQFAFSIDWKSKVRNGYTKNIIRDAMAPYMPQDIAYRRGKIGFNAPLLDWIKGPYKQMFKDIVASGDFKTCALVNDAALTAKLLDKTIDGQASFYEASVVWDEIQKYMWEQIFIKKRSI